MYDQQAFESKMDPPLKFNFPFTPYPIQELFMKELYSALNENKFGIFESPTGTGKSLSICCAALTWLKDHEASIVNGFENTIKKLRSDVDNIESNDDWLQSEHDKIVKNCIINKFVKLLEVIKNRNSEFNELKLGKVKQELLRGTLEKHIKPKISFSSESKLKGDDILEEKVFLNNLKENDDDEAFIIQKSDGEPNSDVDDNVDDTEENNETCNQVQIYYSSRTHSQLSQFLSEIKRSSHSDIRVVTLASRQHYCINPEVQKLKNIHLMDERCMELRKSKQSQATAKDNDGRITKKMKTKSSTSCPFYNQSGIKAVRDVSLGEILDVEELANVGKLAKGCPYYGVRAASKDAQMVLLSHTSALSNLEFSGETVLILDEAHNLGGALASAYTANVPLSVLTGSKTSLSSYMSRYKDKFAPKTLLKLNQILFIINKLVAILQLTSKPESEIYKPFDFLIATQIDHLNMSPLVKFCYESKLPQKLHWFSIKNKGLDQDKSAAATQAAGFKNFLSSMSRLHKTIANVEAEESQETDLSKNSQDGKNEYSGSPMYTLLHFLQLMSTSEDDGRVCIQRDANPYLKYLLLDPAKRFSPITKLTKSIILAGGTMQPDWEFSRMLLSGGHDEHRLHKVSCDHVVDPEHVKAVVLQSGPGGKNLKITHATRNETDTLNEIGRVIHNLCRIVPGGIICFVSSYAYEETLHSHLERSGIFTQISKLKTVFREPKESKNVDKLLDNYQKVIKDCSRHRVGIPGKTGAVLLSVIGGKLSEGLNFSDDLGRCVVVVGLPYGDMRSVEEKARWEYLDKHVGKGAGNANYQANCMKQVNQCIGRAIRHINDWAAMVLLDERYSQNSISLQLPAWIRKSLEVHQRFAPAYGSLARFYKKHSKQ